MARKSIEARFWEKVDASGDCWLWTANIHHEGYGQFQICGRSVAAHRFAYEILVGLIPPGLEIDHLCRVRHCVNPDHLEVVTHRENGLRGFSPMAQQARRTHCIHGHPLSGANLYRQGNGRRCRACNSAAAQRYYRRKNEEEVRG